MRKLRVAVLIGFLILFVAGLANAASIPLKLDRSGNLYVDGNSIGAATTANNLSDLANPQTAARNLGLQYYADNCRPALPNDGSTDDAANLRACMAAMPAGAEMILDRNKPYYFASHANGTAWTSDPCEINVLSGQTLNINGAIIKQSPAEGSTGTVFPICAGAPDFNTPGSSGGTPTFEPIADTVPNQSYVVLSTPANAANYHAGNDLYIDCGSNAGNYDEFVGYAQVNDVNTTTGVLNLRHPMLKPYNHSAPTGCPGSPSAARIYNWTTHPGMTAGAYNAGPLAHDVYIKGGNGWLIQQSGGSWLVGLQGTVRWGVDDLNIISLGSIGFFANYDQLGHANRDTLIAPGCASDNFFGFVFSSNLNNLDYDTLTLTGNPGVGCGSNQEFAFGDNEGSESNHYNHDIATVKEGLSTNRSTNGACAEFIGSWGDVVSDMECHSENMFGVEDGFPFFSAEGTTLNTQGPIKVTDSHISAGTGSALNLELLDDTAIGNTLDCTGSNNCLYFPYWAGKAANNTINLSGCSSNGVGISIGTAVNSSLQGNTIHAVSGTCTAGIKVTGSGTGATLNVVGNTIDQTGFTSLLGSISSTSFSATSTFEGNPGIPDYNGSGTGTPNAQLLSLATALPTSAVTDYWSPFGISAANATQSTVQAPAPYAVTYTQLKCYFSAAQGAGKSDSVYFEDTNDAISCTGSFNPCVATNAKVCSSSGSCVVAVGDPLNFADIIVGSGITARTVSCVVSP